MPRPTAPARRLPPQLRYGLRCAREWSAANGPRTPGARPIAASRSAQGGRCRLGAGACNNRFRCPFRADQSARRIQGSALTSLVTLPVGTDHLGMHERERREMEGAGPDTAARHVSAPEPPLLFLQRAAGNRAVAALLQRLDVQRGTPVEAPGPAPVPIPEAEAAPVPSPTGAGPTPAATPAEAPAEGLPPGVVPRVLSADLAAQLSHVGADVGREFQVGMSVDITHLRNERLVPRASRESPAAGALIMAAGAELAVASGTSRMTTRALGSALQLTDQAVNESLPRGSSAAGGGAAGPVPPSRPFSEVTGE
jgi:hypothetical protein